MMTLRHALSDDGPEACICVQSWKAPEHALAIFCDCPIKKDGLRLITEVANSTAKNNHMINHCTIWSVIIRFQWLMLIISMLSLNGMVFAGPTIINYIVHSLRVVLMNFPGKPESRYLISPSMQILKKNWESSMLQKGVTKHPFHERLPLGGFK